MFELRLKILSCESGRMTAGRNPSTISYPTSKIRTTRGLTLIELLVVVAILTTLVAGVVPVLSPNNVPRKIREAGRGLSTYIKLAQSKAARNGRPAGIMLKKLSVDTLNAGDRGVCLEVYQLEVPPPFSGFSENSTIQIDPAYGRFDTLLPKGGTITFGVGLGDSFTASSADALPPRMFKVGDIIEVAGHRLKIDDPDAFDLPPEEEVVNGVRVDVLPGTDDTPDATKVVRYNGVVYVQMNLSDPPVINFEWLDYNPNILPPKGGRTYKIFRTPEISSEEPFQLPRGTCIDLQASGIPTTPMTPSCCHNPLVNIPGGSGDETIDANLTNNDDGVAVMFGPDGSVSDYYWNQANTFDRFTSGIGEGKPLNDQVFFLIGRRENVPVSITTVNGWNFASQTQYSDDDLDTLRENLNWLNPDSRWLAISSQSGNVVVTENAFLNLRSPRYSPNPVDFANLMQSVPAQMTDARQFAREMKREGGR